MIRFGWMEQPVPAWSSFAPAGQLLEVLGVERSGLPVELYDLGPTHVFVELASPEEVAALTPDLGALARLTPASANCFARTSEGWKTRVFAPAHRVPEDPATGSAAGPLAIHLARHGRIAFGEEIEISQGVEIQRPSRLFARVDGSLERIERVLVGGAAVISRPGRVQASLSATASISGKFRGQRGPEEAAVAREVEPVARRVEKRVRIAHRGGDRLPRRQAATRLAPGASGVMGDEQRWPGIDECDDRRAGLRGAENAGEVESWLRLRLEGRCRLELSGLEVEREFPSTVAASTIIAPARESRPRPPSPQRRRVRE